MSRFSILVEESFSALIEEFRFVVSGASATKEYVNLVARPLQDVCYYLIIRGGPPDDGVDVRLWVAPVDFPDDAIDTFMVGYNIDFGREYDDPPEFLRITARRVQALVPHLDGVAEAARLELVTPSIVSPRLRRYRAVRAAYQAIRTYASSASGQYCRGLFAEAQAVVAGRAKMKQLHAKVLRVAKAMFRDEVAPAEVRHEEFEGDPAMLSGGLARLLYTEALVPWPPGG